MIPCSHSLLNQLPDLNVDVQTFHQFQKRIRICVFNFLKLFDKSGEFFFKPFTIFNSLRNNIESVLLLENWWLGALLISIGLELGDDVSKKWEKNEEVTKKNKEQSSSFI